MLNMEKPVRRYAGQVPELAARLEGPLRKPQRYHYGFMWHSLKHLLAFQHGLFRSFSTLMISKLLLMVSQSVLGLQVTEGHVDVFFSSYGARFGYTDPSQMIRIQTRD